jgi:hypothetical protein
MLPLLSQLETPFSNFSRCPKGSQSIRTVDDEETAAIEDMV